MTATHYLRPPWAARVIGGRMARLFKPQVVSVLSVPGRTTGAWRSTPVAVLAHDGQEYLMAAYGDTEWSRNLRAAGNGRLTRKGAVEEFTAQEVPVGELPGLVEEYLRQFGGMPNVTRTFKALPDPADHPAFRITVTGRRAR
ncbi:nitroreductase/quinone reductase family protein [Streptomyces sp. NPDC020917]|uniref:nitroreductase/quinone reductase family protein n=1 Tax=Streptomyces sp. NPDC020917 TaxID=3365102 RepID=UPI0037B3BBC7